MENKLPQEQSVFVPVAGVFRVGTDVLELRFRMTLVPHDFDVVNLSLSHINVNTSVKYIYIQIHVL